MLKFSKLMMLMEHYNSIKTKRIKHQNDKLKFKSIHLICEFLNIVILIIHYSLKLKLKLKKNLQKTLLCQQQ